MCKTIHIGIEYNERKILAVNEKDTSKTLYDLPVLLSVTDACKMVSLSRATMYQLIKDGELESIRVGNLHRIKTKDFLEYFCLKEEDFMKKENE